MPESDLVVKGAREHNLQGVGVHLPRNSLICFTGVSGSGKSSLAFDTLYAEGQRRYVESLSSFARQFLGQMPKPDVEYISGLSPSISISQKTSGQNPRSTVGTVTEIYDYLRVLYARVGKGYCPECGRPITAQTKEQILQQILALPRGTKRLLLAPLIRGKKGEYRDLFADLLKQGFVRARVDGSVVRLTDDLRLDRRMRHNIEVVIDRITIGSTARSRVAEALELALRIGEGSVLVAEEEGTEELPLSAHYACTHCNLSFEPPSPQLFSFNSPRGMCPTCAGLGEIYNFDPELLVSEPNRSFQQGCIELIGRWREMGRWRRHIYRGVAETLERKMGLESGTILETAWEELDPRIQNRLLWGTGDEHITFTWRQGASGRKWGGTYEGIIPRLLSQYRASNSRLQRRQLEKYMRVLGCRDCHGARLNAQARHVTLATTSVRFGDVPERSLPALCAMSVEEVSTFFEGLNLDAVGKKVAAEVVKEIRGRLGFLSDVGLGYLTLGRTAPTLSGGEMQRIRLAGQIGCGLVGVLYILDEPSIGLHARDNDRLLETLARLRDQGNTVIVVEHDEDTMRAADHVVDFGPGPGVRGGKVVVSGPVEAVMADERSVTGQYLRGTRAIPVPAGRRAPNEKRLVVRGASHNNLKDIDVEIPLGLFVCITGVSGSGKSSLVDGILVEALRRDLNFGGGTPGTHAGIEGLDHLNKMIAIDQSPIGRTPRSNPATYVKVFDEVRHLYSQLPESKARGYKPGRFSFNVSGGRCEACEGNGANKLEMDFLADIWVTCPICKGHRFNRETLQVCFKGKSISQVLEMDIQEALDHFENIPKIREKLQTLHDVGLDYMKLGQPSPTLSGGEAQRIKLARELTKKSTGDTLYLLDEPTTGLHFADIELLLKVLHDFAEAGNTVLVVEHNMEVIKTADWIIDLGPEGGEGGGRVVAAGPPEEIVRIRESYTGNVLRRFLEPKKAVGTVTPVVAAARKGRVKPLTSIKLRGACQHNLKNVDAEIPRDRMTVFCGPSGSGKSSLAMDTIYAEGQRRYVESLSSYARQFVGQMQKPKLEHIEGLSPAVAIEQKHLGHTPRSTVGTVTEIYDYLRILMARFGQPHCPDCDVPVGTQSSDEIIEKIMALPSGTRIYVMAPVEVHVGEKYETLWEDLRRSGFARVRLDGRTTPLDAVPEIDRRRKHDVAVVIDRATVRPDARSRLADSVESALSFGQGVMHVAHYDAERPEEEWRVDVHSQHFACESCGRSFEPLSPHHFSFNSALGWCPACEGLGVQTGANPAELLKDAKLTLAQGAVSVWPSVSVPLFEKMLDALAKGTGVAADVPFDQLGSTHRRMVLYGTGERRFKVALGKGRFLQFQYKGLYNALEEASRVSPALRSRLESFVGEMECSVCCGSRLRDDSAAVRLRGKTIDELCRMPLSKLHAEFDAWKPDSTERKIAGEVHREVHNRLTFLIEVGLEYLSLHRPAGTLSGGEAQRIRLAAQVGSGLCGVLYVLDEPTIGLHPRDNARLIRALKRLRDLGNTLLVVEHDREVVAHADCLLDFGPKAGRFGGQVVAQGTPEQLRRRRNSVTGPYLSGKKAIPVPTNRRMMRPKKSAEPMPPGGGWLTVVGARHNNLKNLDVAFPLGAFTVVTGTSGSGKSSLVNDVLYKALAKMLHRASSAPGGHDRIDGLELVNKVIRVDQRALGQTPTSNPATFTGAFDLIRQLFAQMPLAKLRGYSPRRFSFNVPGGRCEKCEGNGQLKIEMHFLPDIWVECDECRGRRYNEETLEVRYHGKSIAEVLDMSCGEAVRLFQNIPRIRRVLQTLCDVGLDYLTLGQAAPTLSGGEAQRVKLAAELSRPDTGRTLYLLDEPTTGLHFEDLAKLLDVINRLVDLGNSVVVIEHNLDVIKTADWVIDLGPEAGDEGGRIVVAGTPEDLAAHAETYKKVTPAKRQKLLRSHTGEALAPVLRQGPHEKRKLHDFVAETERREGDLGIEDLGADAKMPWESDGRGWHTQDRVSRSGGPCRWDGRVLEDVVDRIEQSGLFSPTDWSNRSTVEIRGKKKSLGWFFHAITGEEWLLKMKIRTCRNTFKERDLIERLDLKPCNDMPDLPLYGSRPRVRCANLPGPWQEVELKVHAYDEVDREEFWKFLDEAIGGFRKFTQKAKQNPEDLMPWKALGRKWHFTRRGFRPGEIEWDAEVLERVVDLLDETAPGGEFLWNNKVLVHYMVPNRRGPWATIHTKKLDALHLLLYGPKNAFALGRVTEIGIEPELEGEDPDYDLVHLRFQTQEDLERGDLPEFLEEHLAAQ